MKTREILDRVAKSARRYTDEGFLVVPARIARTGIQEYRAFELGIEDGDPLRVVRIYRSPEEVFSPEAMVSFEGKPVTDDHPSDFVSADNWKELSKGFARNVRRDGDYLVADLVIADKEAIDKVVGGKVELSNGYVADYDWRPGVTADGEAYDGQQKNIRGNHVAIVDAARCGPACRVSDSNLNPKGKPMADRKVTIDGIPFELPEAAAAAVEKVVQARDAAQAASVTAGENLAAAMTAHAQAIEAKDAEIEQLKKDVITPDQRDAMAAAWAKLIADAKRLVPDFDTSGKTCDAIRREVIGKVEDGRKALVDAVLAGRALDSVDGEVVKMAFAVLAAAPVADSIPNGNGATPNPIADAIKGQQSEDTVEGSGRDAYIKRVTDAWKTPATSTQE